MSPDLEFRRQQTRKYGARTLDNFRPRYTCPTCSAELLASGLITVADVPYQDGAGLLAHARDTTVGWLRSSQTAPRCATCGAAGRLTSLDYHAYHSGADRDLVIRTSPPAGLLRRIPQELLWWSPEGGYQTARELDAGARSVLRTDALLRRAAATLELSGPQQALGDIEAALAGAAGHSALLSFIPPLLAVGRSGLAGAIIDAHLAAHPDDADGHFWNAEITIQVVAHGGWPVEKLAEAEASLERALQLRQPFVEAETARCNLLRLRGDQAGARDCFLQLVARFPQEGAAHFNLGAMLLEGDPSGALEHFTRGEAIAPDDPDYPLGRARALLRLQRREEARLALARGRELAPEHPRVAEIEAALG